MSNKLWNYKFRGLPGFLYVLSGIIISRVLNSIFFYLNKGNFNKIEKGSIFYRGLIYRYPNNIQIGKNCIINKNVTMNSEFPNSYLKIGNNVTIAQNVKLDYTGNLTIHDNVTISENVSIYTHDHGLNPRSIPAKKELRIEKNVWIGSNAVILQNANILGENSVIAACAVITKNIDSGSIVGGNPAKILIKSRYPGIEQNG